MKKNFFVIANPASNSGRTESRLSNLRDRLTREGLCNEFHISRNGEEPSALALEAARSGFSTIVSVGGDGTSSQVAHGILMSKRNLKTSLAILPMGTGNDTVRNFGLPQDIGGAISLLSKGTSNWVDAGCAEFNVHGLPRLRYFLNSGSLGISAEIAASINLAKEHCRGTLFRGKAIYLRGLLEGLISAKAFVVTVHLDDVLRFHGPSLFISVANGPYCGGGIKVAPKAGVTDGFLQVAVVPNWSKLQLFRKFPTFYTGKYVHDEEVYSSKSHRISCKSETEMFVELDGESCGKTPVSFRLLPRQILMVSPR